MSGLRTWIRRHKRYLLLLAAAGLMLAWLIIPQFQRMLAQKPGRWGKIHGRRVSLERGWQAAAICRAMGILDPMLGALLFEGQKRLSPELIWRYLVLACEAEEAGIEATDTEVEERLAAMPALMTDNRFDPHKYSTFLLAYRMTDEELRGALAELIAIRKLMAFKVEAVEVTEAELWADYALRNEEAKVRFVALAPETFAPLVKAEEGALREFYEAHKDVIAEPEAGTAGYKVPERAKVACATAAYDDFAEAVSVSEEEIRAYYEEHKDEFVAPEEEGEEDAEPQPADEEEAAPQGSGDGEGEEEPDASEEPSGSESEASGGEAVAEEGPQAATERPDGVETEGEDEQEEVSYRELAEVREEIEERIRRSKAEEAASRALDAAYDDLEAAAERYIKEPLPLEWMAGRHKLRYEVLSSQDGRQFLSRAELEDALAGAGQIGPFAFEAQLYRAARFETPEGPCICQVLARREPYVEPYSQVEERVAEDYRRQKALEQAEQFADELIEKAVRSSLEQAVAEENVRLALLLRGPNDASLAREQRKSDEQTTHEGGPSEHQEMLRIEQTDFFTRGQAYLPEMSGRRPNVIKKAFMLDKGQIGRVTDGAEDRACYVIEKLDRRDADPTGFHRQKGFLRQYYLQQKLMTALKSWIDELVAASEEQYPKK